MYGRYSPLGDVLEGMGFMGLGKWEIVSILAMAAVAGIFAYSRAGMGGISLLVNILLQMVLVLVAGFGFLLLLHRLGFYAGIADDYFARRKENKVK